MSTRAFDRLEPALRAWQALLGEPHVRRFPSESLADVAEFPSRHVPAMLSPNSREEVVAIVAIANEHGIPLYTVSTGRNWGGGSRMPVREGVLLALGRMNRILEVNERFRYVVLEPGVTQGQLADHLKRQGCALVPSIGGAGTTVSPLGNALERGSGVFGCKVDECLAMEVVLGNGEVIRTGLWNYLGDCDPFVHCYPTGLGPDLRGLFIQSNLGIVTRAVLRLYPRRHRSMVVVGAGPGGLAGLVDAAHELRRSGLLDKGLDIADAAADIDYYPNPSGEALADPEVLGGRLSWTLIGCLPGPERIAAAAREEIEAYFCPRPSYPIHFFSTQDQPIQQQPGWIQEWTKRYMGLPDNSHLDVFLCRGSRDYDLDNNPDAMGFLAVNLVVPAQGQIATRVIDLVDEVATALDLPEYIRSFSELGVGALKGHFSLMFDRSDEAAVSRAHRWKDQVLRELRTIGIYPQRLDVDSMSTFARASQDEYWRMLRRIKAGLDPNGILSPGRYLYE
ncbi:MAG: FAD-binding oxidoreductase [Myxococcota bacterium]